MMTMWEDIVGYCCVECHKWATHWYGDVPLCCRCHVGGDNDIDGDDDFMQREAVRMNTLYQRGLPLDVYDEPDDLSLQWAKEFQELRGKGGGDVTIT